MRWFWWIVIGILVVNGLAIVLIGIMLLHDWIRRSRSASEESEEDAQE